MANQRWHSDKNIAFIKEYRHHRCLWDSKNNQYKVRKVREAAYKSIMEAMNMESVKDVISKIRTLRNTYNNETLKATKKRDSTGELYISKIPWLCHLDFIRNNMENSEIIDEENITEQFDDSSSEQEKTQIYVTGKPSESNSESEILEQTGRFSKITRDSISIKDKKSKRRQSDSPELLLHKNQINELRSFYTSHHQQNIDKDDECNSFGNIIAKKLRKLPADRRDAMMINILQLFIDEQRDGGLTSSSITSL